MKGMQNAVELYFKSLKGGGKHLDVKTR